MKLNKKLNIEKKDNYEFMIAKQIFSYLKIIFITMQSKREYDQTQATSNMG